MAMASRLSSPIVMREKTARRDRQLGSASNGRQKWRWQHLIAIASVPVGLCFAASIYGLIPSGHPTAAARLVSSVTALLVIPLTIAALTCALLRAATAIAEAAATLTVLKLFLDR
jgi:hypothetical protein